MALADPLDEMISPIINPVIFEDPRQSTELRPIFAYHELDDEFVTGGGDVQVYAVQARFRLTDDLSFIAVKDGLVRLDPDSVVEEDTGLANVAAGAKYSFWRNACSIVTAGLTYEIPLGDDGVLQGEGDGVFNPFVSAGITRDSWNFLAHTGFRFPVDGEDSTFYDLHAHVSYKLGRLYPLVELGLNHVLDGGNRLPIADEGQDFFNFGSSESEGETLVTVAAGTRYRLADDIDLGVAYQVPVTKETGTRVIDWRVTADAIFRFDL